MDKEETAKIRSIDSKPSKLYSFNQNQILILVIFVLAVVAGFWIWKAVQAKSLKNEYNTREQFIIKAAADKTETTNRQFLKVITKPYVWAVRSELMQGNLNQLNLYGNDIVKEKNFLSVMIVNAKGTVVSSTNKKFEEKNVLAIYPEINLQADSTIVGKINDSTYIVTSPVMSFNSKLGTLIINYTTKPSILLPAPK